MDMPDASDPIVDASGAPSQLVLTASQTDALRAMNAFYHDPDPGAPNTFVLSGFAGTGKSTLVRAFLDDVQAVAEAMTLVEDRTDPSGMHNLEIILTATTHKAAEALEHATGRPVGTIHSTLGLVIDKDYRTGITTLVSGDLKRDLSNVLLVVDEIGFADEQLLDLLDELAPDARRLFIGDPYQLVDHRVDIAPIYPRAQALGWPVHTLTEIVRQDAASHIVTAATAFRDWVSKGVPPVFEIDGDDLVHLDRDAFNDALVDAFKLPGSHRDVRFLAWTNKRVIDYNRALDETLSGRSEFAAGDIAVNARYLRNHTGTLRVDRTVGITELRPALSHGVAGHRMILDGKVDVFVPTDASAHARLETMLRREHRISDLKEIDREWADLRHVYASTVNKSQGSTFDTVFVDLDDINRCPNISQTARMLYVAVSRARTRVVFTGEIRKT